MQSTIIPSPPGNRLEVPRWSRAVTAATALLVGALAPSQLDAQILAWDFTGESTVDTSTAEIVDSNLTAESALITRGPGAAASAGNNSFRTTGFQNNGISTDNTDYFQTTISAVIGYTVSISTIDATFAGTNSFTASPGVSSQFAYSLDGSNFTLIGSPSVTVGNTTLPQISVSDIPALQNVPAGTTVTLRYYASGQTGTGGWGFNSPSAGTNGLALGGTVDLADSSSPNIVTTSNFSQFATLSGTASASQSFTVTGANLTSDITLAAPAGFEVSSNDVSYAASTSLPAAGGTGYVRIASTTGPGPVSGNLTLTSPGASERTIALTGTVGDPNLITLTFDPTTLPEDSVTPFVGTITIPATRASDVVFTLESDNTSAATVPATATIIAGNLSTTFDATPVASSASFANESSQITVSAAGFTSASATVTTTNVDVPPVVSIDLLPEQTYEQDFDALGNTAFAAAVSETLGVQTSLGSLAGSELNGFYVAKIGGDGAVPTSISPNIGGTASGSVYNYGAEGDPDRALGMVASGSNVMAMGAIIKNNSPTETFTGLTLSFTAEFWRSSTAVQNTHKFAYGIIDNDFVTPQTFLSVLEGITEFSPLDIVGPSPVASNGALDGNAPENQAVFTNVSIPITLLPGESAFIRWQDLNDGGNDAGLAIDDLTIVANQSGLAFPEFDIPDGVYLSDQVVKVSNFNTYPSGTEIRYTLDGSTPTAASTLYIDAAGIPINTGTGNITLKAIALQTGPSDSSLVATATYQLPLNVATLAELRASSTGSQIYRVLGQATFTAGTSFRNTKFFQDGAAGIQIDDSAGNVFTTYVAGDNVAGMTGRISVFNGQLQFVPLEDFGAPISSGNVVTPLSRTLATLTDADQSMLVTLSNVTFESAGATFGGGGSNTNINDGSASGIFRNVFGESDITGNLIPSGLATVTGVIQKINATTFTIAARSMSDIVSDSPGSTFASWAALYAPGQPAFADHDNDGVSNGLEYFMGETGFSFTPNPGIVENKIVWPKDPGFIGSYSVQTSPDLVIWTDVGSTEVGNTVEFNFPPPGSGKVFARMKVIVTP